MLNFTLSLSLIHMIYLSIYVCIYLFVCISIYIIYLYIYIDRYDIDLAQKLKVSFQEFLKSLKQYFFIINVINICTLFIKKYQKKVNTSLCYLFKNMTRYLKIAKFNGKILLKLYWLYTKQKKVKFNFIYVRLYWTVLYFVVQ